MSESSVTNAVHRSRLRSSPMEANLAGDRARKLLEKCTLFSALDQGARDEISNYARPRRYTAGEPICLVGDPGDSMMAVIVGVARVWLPTVKGREIIIADLQTGELFGEIALLDGKTRSANVTAYTNCELFVWDRRDILPFLKRNPNACIKLMETLCARIRRSDELMADIAVLDLPARLAKTLLRHSATARTAGPIKLSFSQSELAAMAGGTRENVNRCLREWQRRGILELKQRWTIIREPEALRQILESV